MTRTFIRAGLLIDSWRDQPPQTESSKMNLQDNATPIIPVRGTSDGVPSTISLASLIALGAVKRQSH